MPSSLPLTKTSGSKHRRLLRKHKAGFSLVEVLLTVFIMSIIAGGMTLTIQGMQGTSDKKGLMEAEFEMLNIAMAAALHSKIEGTAVPNADTLFSKGYLIGNNLSPFKTPYKLGYRGGRAYIWCTGPKGEIIGDRM